MEERYGTGSNYAIFYAIWSDSNFCDCAIGVYESAGISGGSDYAASGCVCSTGANQFFVNVVDYSLSGIDRKYSFVWTWKIWGEFFPGKIL